MVRALMFSALLPSVFSVSLSRIHAREDGFMIDEVGRVRIFHGFNDVQEGKGTGYTPGGTKYLPKLLMEEQLVEDLERMGFNGFRLPMMWAATMPQSDMLPDAAYLETMLNVTKFLEKHNMFSLLDMHQDGWSSNFGGYDGAPQWLVNQSHAAHEFPWPLHKPFKSWGEIYLTEATGRAFQDFYDNANHALDSWTAFWKIVADKFKDQKSVLGYELINEPFPGNPYHNPLVLLPGYGGKHNLEPTYKKAAQAIREVDNETLIFFEPVTWGMIFPGTGVAGSGFDTPPDAQSVLSFHYYCWLLAEGTNPQPYKSMTKAACDKAFGPEVFRAVAKDRKHLKVPSFLTEWGDLWPNASTPEAAGTMEVEAVLNLADENFQSWMFWDICVFPNKSATGEAQGWNMDAMRVLSRPFAQAIAGTPSSMKFDSATASFELEYVRDPTITAPTEIVVPALRYPGGFDVALSPGLSWSMIEGRTNVIAVSVSASGAATIAKVSITSKSREAFESLSV